MSKRLSRFAPVNPAIQPLVPAGNQPNVQPANVQLVRPRTMGHVRPRETLPAPITERIDVNARRRQKEARMQQQLRPFMQYFDAPSLMDRVNSLDGNNAPNNFYIQRQPFLEEDQRKTHLPGRIKLFNKSGSGIDESHPSMTINEFKKRKAEQLESKLNALEDRTNKRFDAIKNVGDDPDNGVDELYEKPIYRMFTGDNDGITSVKQMLGGAPLTAEQKKAYEALHMGANVKAVTQGGNIHYSPFLSSAGSLRNYINTDLQPTAGDNNLLNTVFSKAPRLGAFAIPKKAAIPARGHDAELGEVLRGHNLAYRENEVVVDTDQYNLPDGKLYSEGIDATHNFANPFFDNLQMTYPNVINSRAIEPQHLPPQNQKAESLAQFMGYSPEIHYQRNNRPFDLEKTYTPGRGWYNDINAKLAGSLQRIDGNKTASPLEPMESNRPIENSHQYNLAKFSQGSDMLENLLFDIPTTKQVRNIDVLGWTPKMRQEEVSSMKKYNEQQHQQKHSQQLREMLRDHHATKRHYPFY